MKTFKISKKYTNQNWIELGLVDQTGTNWISAVDIIKDRFESRFFNQIDKFEHDEFSGFVIMSIDCLLIETLMQFYLGTESTDKTYPRENWKAFKDFFKQSRYFKDDFKTNKICQIFYQHFRCGLLHQAQTKLESRIKIYQSELLEYADADDISKGLIIDRAVFHKKLKSEFDDYIKKLTVNANSFNGDNLRIKAIDKMKLVCNES